MWQPNLQSVAAVAPDRFAFCLADLQYSDPFSAVIEYNGAFSQPWSRIDVSREIVDLTYWTQEFGAAPILMGLSNEGDVHTFTGDAVPVQKIPGAGVLSPDADGRGQVWTITSTPKALFVAGENAQIYRSEDGRNWATLGDLVADINSGPAPMGFETAQGYGANGVLISAKSQQSLVDASKPAADALRDGMSMEEMMAAISMTQDALDAAPVIGKVVNISGDASTVLFHEDGAHINGMHLETDGTLWAFGAHGLILKGDVAGPLSPVGFHGDTQNLLSATRMGGDMIFASDYMLHRFDGHMLSPLKPKLDPTINDGVPTPLALIGFGDVLIYVDRKHGICRWDGTTWDWVSIPDALRQRPFTGLPPR